MKVVIYSHSCKMQKQNKRMLMPQNKIKRKKKHVKRNMHNPPFLEKIYTENCKKEEERRKELNLKVLVRRANVENNHRLHYYPNVNLTSFSRPKPSSSSSSFAQALCSIPRPLIFVSAPLGAVKEEEEDGNGGL